MADLTAVLSGSGPSSVPQVRINEVLLALVRAKVAIKQLSKVRSRPPLALVSRRRAQSEC